MGNVKKIKKITHGILLVLLLSLPPGVAAEDPPCMTYAYVQAEGEPHASLIMSENYVFGSRVIVISNCNNTYIEQNGVIIASSNGGTVVTFISPGIHQITIGNEGSNQTFENVTFIQQGQLSRVINLMPNEYNPHSEPWTPEEISDLELYSGVGAILLSWLLVVGVLWKLINNYQDRNFCQEVR